MAAPPPAASTPTCGARPSGRSRSTGAGRCPLWRLAIRSARTSAGPGVGVRERADAGVRVRVYRPLGDAGCLVWHNRGNRAGWSAYLGGVPGVPGVPAYAAAARCANLRGLPPAWIGVGDLDIFIFLDEDRGYAARLAAAGVAVETLEVEGAPHGFDMLAPDVPLARTFAASQTAFLRERLGTADAR